MEPSSDRLSWDAIWEQVASQIGLRTLCVRARVGAVIADRENRIVATGYNGPPAGFEHDNLPCTTWCGRAGELNAPYDRCAAVHAEANALLSCDRGARLGGTMYVNKHPCWECCKLIANSGLARLVVRPSKPTPPDHHSYDTYDFMETCGITVEVVE